jgi:hypothetical protein
MKKEKKRNLPLVSDLDAVGGLKIFTGKFHKNLTRNNGVYEV